jgi:TPP-dependent pyruvate/acetoin dehydrogenase alpha subunit
MTSSGRSTNAVTAEQTIDLRAAHLLMCRIREFEETALRKSNDGVLHGSLHLYVGMEAIAAGVFSQLRRGDWFASTHRGHGHTLACGVAPVTMFAELYGREAGMAGGKAGSMHMADLSRGHLGGTGIVGASIHLAAGAALSCQLLQPGAIAVAFFGDGAANRGSFHEGLNMAALWQLPVVFVCENNAFGQWTRHEAASSVPTVAERAAAYGLPGARADGNDVEAVAKSAATAIERARRGEGPSLLEFVSYRLRDHSGGRDQRRYRERDEIEHWRQHDPIALNRQKLFERELVGEAELDEIEEQARREIVAAAESALTLPEPDPLDAISDITKDDRG